MSANSPKSQDFAALAKRISSWTTKSLLTAIVLVAGLGFGRQVLTWWAADAMPAGQSIAGLPGNPLGDPSQLHTLQFGANAWSLQRRVIAGDKDKAAEQLRATCRDVLLANMQANKPPSPPAPLPQAGEGSFDRAVCREAVCGAGVPPASNDARRDACTTNTAASEDEFLTFLSNSTPVDQEPGKWRLYELREAFPMAVGVRRPETDASEPPETGVNLAQLGYRVVIWGLAMPTSENQWALCMFQAGPTATVGGSGLSDVPLPPDGRRTLSLAAAGGGGIVAFGGPDQPAEWKRFYDDWFARQSWQPVADWQPVGTAWYAKFAKPNGGDAVDIRFGPDGRGGVSGLLVLTPGGPR